MKTKRVLSFLLACLMLLGICPLSVFATDGATDENEQPTKRAYADYYVQDGLVFFWNGEGNTLGETVKKVTSLADTREGKDLAITHIANDRNDTGKSTSIAGYSFSNTANKETGFLTVDKGVLVRGGKDVAMKLVLTDLIPTRTIGEAELLADMTLEVSQMHPNALNKSSASATPMLFQRNSNGDGWAFGPVSASGSKGAYNSVNYNGTYYYAFTLKENSKTVYIPNVSRDNGNIPYYEYDGTKMNKLGTFVTAADAQAALSIEQPANVITPHLANPMASSTDNSFLALSPYDASGHGPYQKFAVGSKTFDDYSGEAFMNAPVDTAFTTSMIFDYDYKDTDTATEYGYALTLGRDGEALGQTVTGTYNQDSSKTFVYGTAFGARIYYSIRLYDIPLTEAQIAQNHFVDVAYQLDADMSAYDAILAREDAERVLPFVHAVANGKTAANFTKESFAAAIANALLEADKPQKDYTYAELYVQDGLVYFWSGEGNTLGETVKKVTSLADTREGKDLAITHIANDRTNTGTSTSIAGYSFSNTANKETGFLTVDKGVLVRGGKDVAMKLVLTDLIPTRTIGETKALADMTLEVSQMHPNALNKSSASATPMLFQRNSNGDGWAFGPVSVSGTKGAYNSVNYNGTYYYAFTLKENSETVYIKEISDTSKGNISYYTYNGKTMIEMGTFATQADAKAALSIETPANTIFDPLATIGSSTNNSFLGLSPYDAAGHGPYQKFTVGSKTFDDYSGEAFMNAPVDTAFTTSVIFDYDYKDTDTATEYGYTLTLGRDGEALAQTVTGTYKQDSSKNFVYGTAFGARIYYSIRLYDRALSTKEIAQNNFIDVAYQLDADLSTYLSSPQALKDRIHLAFASYSADDFTAESFKSEVDALIAANGFDVIGGMDGALTFEGFAGSLQFFSGVRAVFHADERILSSFETAGVNVEYGVLVSPTGDPTALTVSYDGGNATPSEGAILRVAYASGSVNNFFENSTDFALAVTNPTNGISIDLASDICFRAYMTLSDETDSKTFYVDATGETLGASITFNEVYSYLYVNGYEENAIVKNYEEEILSLFESVESELAEVKDALAGVESLLAEADALVALRDEYFATAPTKTGDPFVAFYYAYNALLATQRLDGFSNELALLAPDLEAKIAALENALKGETPDAKALETAAVLTAGFKREIDKAEAYLAALSESEDQITETDIRSYYTAYADLFADVEAIPTATLNDSTLNGYIIIANEDALLAAKTLALTLGESYGAVTYVMDEAGAALLEGSQIRRITLENGADMESGTYLVQVDAESGNITLTGAGDNGALHAVEAITDLFGADKTAVTLETHTGATERVYAADSFLKDDGTLDRESAGELNVLFIGGSLTEQTGVSEVHPWSTGVVNYLKEVFPNKTVNHINAGIGGTNSEAGAARFCEHVEPYAPDIIFIDFTVNDDMNGFDRERGQYTLENFLYQCSQLEKIPSVIYLHTPPATMPDSAVYAKWAKQRDYKDEWAAHYDVSTVNIYDYSYGKFEKEKAEGGKSDYIEWLDDYYGSLQEEAVNDTGKYGRYNVHGGYQLYLEAILAALSENAAEMLSPFRFMPYLNTGKTEQIERIHEKAAHDDEIFDYSEGWKSYKTQADYTGHGAGGIGTAKHWQMPFLADGVAEGEEGASVTFTTTANDFTLYYMSIAKTKAANFEIYVNGANVRTITTGAQYVQPTIRDTIHLNNPTGDELTVEIRIVRSETATAETSYARFTSIWFGYNQ